MRFSFFKPRRGGFTLTEVAIVLAAMGLVMGGIWAVVSVVWDNFQISRAQQEVITVAQNVRDYYVNVGSIKINPTTNCSTGADLTTLLNDDNHRLIPAEMRAKPSVNTSSINHALNAMGSSPSTGSFRVTCRSNGNRFRLSLWGLNKKDCMGLLMQFPVLTPELGVTYLGTGSGDTGGSDINLTNIENPTSNGALPMTPQIANNWCADTNGRNNRIDIDFKLRN